MQEDNEVEEEAEVKEDESTSLHSQANVERETGSEGTLF